MAFTTEELNKYFDEYENQRYISDRKFKDHPNYQIVFDYLTGASNSLQGLTNDDTNFALIGLPSLLSEIEPPGKNDQLVIDVLLHPDIYEYARHFLTRWLLEYVVEKNTDSAVNAGISVLHSASLSNHDIFEYIIFHADRGSNISEFILSGNSALKSWMVNNMPKQLITSPKGMYWGGTDWSYLYFVLLDETQPASARQYAVLGATQQFNRNLEGIVTYNDGKYLQTIVDWIENPASGQGYATKFALAAKLFEFYRDRFLSLATKISSLYLDHYKNNKSAQSWESGLHFPLEEGKDEKYWHLSAIAFHLLLINDREEAKRLLEDWLKAKDFLDPHVLKVLFFHLKQDALPYIKRALTLYGTGTLQYFREIISLLSDSFQAFEYTDVMWQSVSSKSKPVREYVAALMAQMDKEAEQKAIRLLQSKNAETRQTAALILSQFGSAEAIKAVKDILHTEANDNARDILLQIITESLPKTPGKDFIDEMIQAAAERGKLSKPVEAWLDESEMPGLFYADGTQLTQQEVRFIIYRMSRVKAMRSDMEAKYLIDQIDREQAAPFAKHIIKLFIEKGAKPEHKYLLALAAMLGNDEVTDKIRSTINGWIEAQRSKMAEYGIGALALQGSDKALRLVEWYSRKYRNKKASVGNAALQALIDAAEELGISTHELGDRIVPDFGFDDLFRHFTVDGEEYRAFVDSNFKLAFFNEDNKKLKALPSATSPELKEEFKNISKEIRDVVKSQSLRLEYYLVIQRRWSAEEWKKFYLSNPVMFIYAIRLLWGRFAPDGKLIDCFICQEDTTLVNAEDDEIELDEDSLVGIVHPIQLDNEQLQTWKQKFFDLSIDPIFPQLDRKVATLPEGDKHKKIDHQFEGIETETGAIKGTLEKYGWRKGDTGDGGYVDRFRFENATDHLHAILEVEGVFVGGYGYDHEPKLGRLFFIDSSKKEKGWFAQPKDDKDERLVPLSNVGEIFYSEVVGSIMNIKRKEMIATTL